MLTTVRPPIRFRKVLEILQLRFQQAGLGKQLEEHFQGVGDVRLRLAFEKALVTPLAKAGGGVHDELTQDEVAFYDALETNDSAVCESGFLMY